MGNSDTNEIVAALRKVESAIAGGYPDDSNTVATLDKIVEHFETLIDIQKDIYRQLQLLNEHHESE